MTTEERFELDRQWRETGWGEIISFGPMLDSAEPRQRMKRPLEDEFDQICQFGPQSDFYAPIQPESRLEPQTSSYGLANVLGEPRTRSIRPKESFPWRFGLLVATVIQGGIVAVIWFALWAWPKIEAWIWRMAR